MRTLLASPILALTFSLPAQATLLGQVIDLNGNPVDPVDPTTDEVEFYIPLSEEASGFFGHGAGETADTCSTTDPTYPDCNGGWLGMLIEFEPITEVGTYQLTLEFDDLDLLGVNDPWFFVESLLVVGHNIMEFVWTAGDDIVYSANQDTQTLVADIFIDTSSYYLGLQFGSHIFADGTFTNSFEIVTASLDLVAVPEPGTLSLLGAGLIAAGVAGRRRRKAKAQHA